MDQPLQAESYREEAGRLIRNGVADDEHRPSKDLNKLSCMSAAVRSIAALRRYPQIEYENLWWG